MIPKMGAKWWVST